MNHIDINPILIGVGGIAFTFLVFSIKVIAKEKLKDMYKDIKENFSSKNPHTILESNTEKEISINYTQDIGSPKNFNNNSGKIDNNITNTITIGNQIINNQTTDFYDEVNGRTRTTYSRNPLTGARRIEGISLF